MAGHTPAVPVVAIHGGAGGRAGELDEQRGEYEAALHAALRAAADALGAGGGAVDAAQAAVTVLEDAELFNAGRGAALCSDGTVELSASLMRGSDRAAGAVAGVRRTRHPIAGARAVLDASPHVLLYGQAADDHAAAAGADMCRPSWFVTERQLRRLRDGSRLADRGTVGAVCLDAAGCLGAATSTGGIRGQAPGRVGDSPLPGAGTWADERMAVSCTGDGEMFIRAGAARHVATLVEGGMALEEAVDRALAEVEVLGGQGGMIALDRGGSVAMPFRAAAMPRGAWRAGEKRFVWV